MIRLRLEQIWTCNVIRHHRPLLSPSGSSNKLGTPWCNARRILLQHEAQDENSDRNSVSCVSHLQRYGVTARDNVSSVCAHLYCAVVRNAFSFCELEGHHFTRAVQRFGQNFTFFYRALWYIYVMLTNKMRF
jgi:hypothetical protein